MRPHTPVTSTAHHAQVPESHPLGLGLGLGLGVGVGLGVGLGVPRKYIFEERAERVALEQRAHLARLSLVDKGARFRSLRVLFLAQNEILPLLARGWVWQ